MCCYIRAGETAQLLAQLSTVECRKDMAITAPVNLTPEKEQVMVSFSTALILLQSSAFKSLVISFFLSSLLCACSCSCEVAFFLDVSLVGVSGKGTKDLPYSHLIPSF